MRGNINDSTYIVNWPEQLENDTTVAFTFTFTTFCGDTVDTTVNVSIHRTYAEDPDTVVTCWNHPYFFGGSLLYQSGDYQHDYTSKYGCDSLVSLNLTVNPIYNVSQRDYLCEDNKYVFYGDSLTAPGYYSHVLTTVDGCDSTITLRLLVRPNYDIHFYDTIIYGDSVLFEGEKYDTAGDYSVTFSSAYGCDSVRTLHLHCWRRVRLDSILCQDQLPFVWNGVTFTDREHQGNTWVARDSVYLDSSSDMLIVMTVTVHDTSYLFDVFSVCDSMTWRDGITYYADTLIPLRRMQDIWGCDSSSGMQLTVYHSAKTEVRDTFCFGQTYDWNGLTIGDSSNLHTQDFSFIDSLSTVDGCDSLVYVNLLQLGRPIVEFRHEVDCNALTYTIGATVSLDRGGTAYRRWESAENDPTLEGHEGDKELTVASPINRIATYYLHTDYRESPLCPAVDTLRLNPILIPEAKMRLNPDHVKYDQRWFDATDISTG